MQKLGYSSSKLSATVSILGILAVVLDKFGRELHYALYIVTRSNNSAQGSHFSSNVAYYDRNNRNNLAVSIHCY
jgi:hypothetical protein